MTRQRNRVGTESKSSSKEDRKVDNGYSSYITKEEEEIYTRIPKDSFRGRFRSLLYPSVKRGVSQIVSIQKTRHPIQTALWDFISIAGSHEFFVAFFPMIIHGFGLFDIGGRLLAQAAMGIYLGNILKDYLCLPRPTSPPVLQLNAHGGKEFGFISTHAVAAVALPMYLIIQLVPFNTFEFYSFLLLAFTWIFLVCYSRLYLGMHCLTDVLGGIALGVVLLIAALGLEHIIDATNFQLPNVPLNVFLLGLGLLLLHPEPVDKCPCFEDSACFLGSSAGFFAANAVRSRSYIITNYSLPFCVLRWLIGFGLLVGTRLVVKPVIRKVAYSTMESFKCPTHLYIPETCSASDHTTGDAIKPIVSPKWNLDIFLKYSLYFAMVEVSIEHGLTVASFVGLL